MANLTTKYMGLELKNPIIVGANNMVTDIDEAEANGKSRRCCSCFQIAV